jgi:hypothetical protein
MIMVSVLTFILPEYVCKFLDMVYAGYYLNRKRSKYELTGILWKIKHYAACLKNAPNLLVA